ncbi:MAG: hypothetical protein HY906_08875 [Deltaproteobacteria bacterium]|nr:hypothetical protein [Deltaproteobacteria bacterium]
MRVVASMLAVAVAAALGAGCGGSRSGLLEVCARVSACSLGSGSFTEGCNGYALIDRVGRTSEGTEDRLIVAIVDCVEHAPDCAGVEACTTASATETAACGSGDVHICVGDVLVECDGTTTPAPDAFDCASAGLVCGQTAAGARCGTASCDPATTPARCDGDLAITCDEDGHVLRARDCRFAVTMSCSGGGGGGVTCQSRVGETCAVVDGEPRCVGGGDPCDEATFQNSCDGSVMITCAGGAIGRRDCADLDPALTCRLDSRGAAECAAVAQECDEHTAETCTGGVITFCLLGEVTTVDCAAYGLSGCTTLTENEQTVARCTP